MLLISEKGSHFEWFYFAVWMYRGCAWAYDMYVRHTYVMSWLCLCMRFSSICVCVCVRVQSRSCTPTSQRSIEWMKVSSWNIVNQLVHSIWEYIVNYLRLFCYLNAHQMRCHTLSMPTAAPFINWATNDIYCLLNVIILRNCRWVYFPRIYTHSVLSPFYIIFFSFFAQHDTLDSAPTSPVFSLLSSRWIVWKEKCVFAMKNGFYDWNKLFSYFYYSIQIFRWMYDVCELRLWLCAC